MKTPHIHIYFILFKNYFSLFYRTYSMTLLSLTTYFCLFSFKICNLIINFKKTSFLILLFLKIKNYLAYLYKLILSDDLYYKSIFLSINGFYVMLYGIIIYLIIHLILINRIYM
jgi:hypothetical protein